MIIIHTSLEPEDDIPVPILNMTTELDVMRKAYKSNDDIRHALTTATEEGIRYDRTWNKNYELLHCGY